METKAVKNIALMISITASFAGAFMMTGITIALPDMGKTFAMEAVLLGWVITSFSLTLAAFFLPSGRMADIFGRKRIFLLGLVVFASASFLCAFAQSAYWLIGWRAIQGIGAAMAASNSIAILTSVFPGNERGRALGTCLAATYVGAMVGPFLGGAMTEYLGWRSLFYLTGFLSLITIAMILLALKGEWAESKGEKFDTAGSGIFFIALIVFMYGFTILLTIKGLVLVLFGILGMTAFVWWEIRTPSPILNINAFRKNRPFVFSSMATFINYSASLAGIILLTLFLQYNKGYSPKMAGFILLSHSIVMAVVAPLGGRLSDRFDAQVLAAMGLSTNFLVFIFFFFLDESTAIGLFMTGLAFFGVGWGFFSSANSNAIMGSVERKHLGVASAMLGTMRSVGMMFSMGINMILFSIYLGNVEITPEHYPAFLKSTKAGFAIFAILCLLGAFVQLSGRKRK